MEVGGFKEAIGLKERLRLRMYGGPIGSRQIRWCYKSKGVWGHGSNGGRV